MTSADGQKGRQERCPICGAPVRPAHQPFCSRRCADVDLSRWFRGRYQIAGRADDEDHKESGDLEDEPEGGRPGRSGADDGQ